MHTHTPKSDNSTVLAFLSHHENQSNMSKAVTRKLHISGGPLEEDEDEELVRSGGSFLDDSGLSASQYAVEMNPLAFRSADPCLMF